MKAIWAIVLMGVCAAAQVPDEDSRNVNIPGGRTHFPMPVYSSLEEWESRAAHLRKQILFSAGLLPLPERMPLHPLVFGRLERDGYTIEKVLLETMPGFYLGGNLYRPRGKEGRFPAVAAPHGHWPYGRLEHNENVSVAARCVSFARQGYVVFSWDMIGYNDTVQTPHHFWGAREELWGFGPLGLQLWNSMRAIDFLQSLPEVDPERIGVTGGSGGGTQTFLISAVDPRMKVAAPVNMISATMQGGVCESAPGLRVGTFNVEIGALMAPKPLLLVSASGDWTRNTPQEEFPAIQSVYKLYGKAENVASEQFDAPHNFNQQSRGAVYRFFGRHLLGVTDPSLFEEKPFRPEIPRDLLALHNRTLPANALNYEQILDQWISEAKRQTAAATPAELRERLTYALAAEWPAEVLSRADGERIVLSRKGRGDRVPGIWLRGKGAVAVVVHAEGAEAARNSAAVKELAAAGRSVLMIDAFQTGAAKTERRRHSRQYHVYNKSDMANRVQDILTALAFLGRSGAAPIELVGLGHAGVWCLFAAAVAQGDVVVRAEMNGFAGHDQDFLDRFFVPGIQRAGGIPAAMALVKRR